MTADLYASCYTAPPAGFPRAGVSEPSDEAANLSQDPTPPSSACYLPDPEDQDGDPR